MLGEGLLDTGHLRSWKGEPESPRELRGEGESSAEVPTCAKLQKAGTSLALQLSWTLVKVLRTLES